MEHSNTDVQQEVLKISFQYKSLTAVENFLSQKIIVKRSISQLFNKLLGEVKSDQLSRHLEKLGSKYRDKELGEALEFCW